jgi:hypothetical protein
VNKDSKGIKVLSVRKVHKVNRAIKASKGIKVFKDSKVSRVIKAPMLYGTLLVRMVLVLVMPLVTLLHTLARLGIE